MLHYVLKTGEYFSCWTRLHISLDCSFCPGQLETLEHLLLSCAFANEVWIWAIPLFCKLLGDPNFVPSLQTLIGLDFVDGFPMVTQKLKHFEKVACTAENAILLVEFSFKQTRSKKFEFWRRVLKLSMFEKDWSIGEAFYRVDCLDHLVFTSS